MPNQPKCVSFLPQKWDPRPRNPHMMRPSTVCKNYSVFSYQTLRFLRVGNYELREGPMKAWTGCVYVFR